MKFRVYAVGTGWDLRLLQFSFAPRGSVEGVGGGVGGRGWW